MTTRLLEPPTRLEGPAPVAPAAPASITLRGCDDAAWDAYVASHPDGTIFHARAWQRAIARSFPHALFDATASRAGRIVGVLPLHLVRVPLLGSTLISAPYAVGGGALADDAPTCEGLIAAAIELAEGLGARAVDLRSMKAGSTRLGITERYLGFSRALPRRAEEVLGFIPRKARAVIRQAIERHQLTVLAGDEHLETVWRLYCENMRRLGSLNYPITFFRALIDETPGAHRVSLVTWNGRPVAGVLSFVHGPRIMPYFYGATEPARRCGAAHFAYFELMRWAVERGLREFDFGRSRRDNTGSADFKRFFGFEPVPLEYQRWTAPRATAPALTPSSPGIRLARRVWTHLPRCATRALGARLSRYLPG